MLASRGGEPTLACPDFYLGCAGPDPYFYDVYPPTPFIRSRVDLGRKLHHIPGRELFDGVLSAMKPENVPFAAGLLCHFCLDAAVHPYVYARQEEIGHTQMEVVLDMQVHKAHKEELGELYELQEGANLAAIDGYMSRLVEALTGEKTEGVYRRSARKFRRLHLLSRDPRGTKRRLARRLEGPLGLKKSLSGYMYTHGIADERDFLNKNHASWAPFGKGAMNRRDSFLDLFNQGLDLCREALPLLLKGDGKGLCTLTGERMMY